MSSSKTPQSLFFRTFSSPDCLRYRDKRDEWSPRSEESDPSMDSDEENHASDTVAFSSTVRGSFEQSNPPRNSLVFPNTSLSTSFELNSKASVIFGNDTSPRSRSLVVGRRSRSVGLKDVDLTHNPAALYIREARVANRSPTKSQVRCPLTRHLSCPAPNLSTTIGQTSKTGKSNFASNFDWLSSTSLSEASNSRLSSTPFSEAMYLGSVQLYSTTSNEDRTIQAVSDQGSITNREKSTVVGPDKSAVPVIDLTMDDTSDEEDNACEKVSAVNANDEREGVFNWQKLVTQKVSKREGLDKSSVFSFSDDEDSDTDKGAKRKSIKHDPDEPTTLPEKAPHVHVQAKGHYLMAYFMKASFCLAVCTILLSLYLHRNPHGFCLDSEFHNNVSGIKMALERELYGQHIAQKIVTSAMKNHIKKHNGKKPLIMSFHGWTGTGKNFVSNIIAEHLFKQKTRSPFLHKFIIPLHFPHQSEVDIYSKQLRDWIHGNISKCSKGAIFIFDEMDKIPIAMIDTIKDAILHYSSKTSGSSLGNVIFIFLSNSGGHAINQHVLKHCSEGKSRESITLNELGHVLHNFTENYPDVWFTNLWKLGLIDHIVPFLPLERTHIKQCVSRDMLSKGHVVTETIVANIADQLEYFPRGFQFFSVSGCKKVSSRVDVVMG